MKDLYGKKEKHDHKFSNLLKGCILAIVMLAPFIAILSKIVYVSANKNAKDSYYGETINESKYEKKDIYQININEQVYIISDAYVTLQNNIGAHNYLYLTDFQIKDTQTQEINNPTWNINTAEQLRLITNENNELYYEVRRENENSYYILRNNYVINISFKFLRIQSQSNLTEVSNYIYILTYNKYSYLDNVFYYAIDQSKDEEILKWTKDTPIYNVINTMNNGLGLSANHILTYLLTYWSIILAIYIVFDIIIFVFTKITHYLQ